MTEKRNITETVDGTRKGEISQRKIECCRNNIIEILSIIEKWNIIEKAEYYGKARILGESEIKKNLKTPEKLEYYRKS